MGHEWPSLVGVVTAYFTGLALGAWLFGERVVRSPRPGFWYAGLELACAAWVFGTTPWLGQVSDVALAWAGPTPGSVARWMTGFLAAGVVVIPAAAALGATLPAMECALTLRGTDTRTAPLLYAWNTLGAMFGVLGTVFGMLPVLGLRATLMAAAALQTLAGLVAWGWFSRAPTGFGPSSPPQRVADLMAKRGSLAWSHAGGGTLGVALGSGFLGMAAELLGIRALTRLTENTIHTYAAVLAVFLAANALGAASWRRLGAGGDDGRRRVLGFRLSLGLAAALAMEGGAVWLAPGLLESLRSISLGGWLTEAVLAAWVLGVPALGMGALFALILERSSSGTGPGGLGRVLACNTLGGALAGPCWVGVILPAVGWVPALCLGGVGYVALACAWGWTGCRQASGPRSPSRIRVPDPWFLLATAPLVLLLLPGSVPFLEAPPGSKVVRRVEGAMASVAVIATPDGHRVLRVNNHFQQGGTATAVAARRQAHLPLLLHPAPRRALFLGVGTGITLGACTTHPGLGVDAVELLPEVLQVLDAFEPENTAPARQPGIRLVAGDARRYLRTTPERYDVIVADLFHPSEDGAGFLYTREQFAGMRSRLVPGGLACQWLPLHQMEWGVFQDVVRTFLEVFPDASLWLLRFNVDIPVVGLMAGGMAGASDLEALASACGPRMAGEPLADALRTVALNEPVRLLGCRLADARSLERLAREGAVATDDRPRVLFRSAADAYRIPTAPQDRLVRLLAEVEPGFLPSAQGGDSGGWLARLAAFRLARDTHLRGLARESRGERRQAGEDYLASAAASPDYTAGYAQAVLVASAFATEDPAFSQRMLRELVRARPEQRLASELLRRLEAGPGASTRPSATGPAAPF